jgi:hypothetical protein
MLDITMKLGNVEHMVISTTEEIHFHFHAIAGLFQP